MRYTLDCPQQEKWTDFTLNNWSMHSLYKFVGDVCTFSIYNNQNLEAWFLRMFAAAIAPWMSLTDSSVTGLMGDGL